MTSKHDLALDNEEAADSWPDGCSNRLSAFTIRSSGAPDLRLLCVNLYSNNAAGGTGGQPLRTTPRLPLGDAELEGEMTSQSELAVDDAEAAEQQPDSGSASTPPSTIRHSGEQGLRILCVNLYSCDTVRRVTGI